MGVDIPVRELPAGQGDCYLGLLPRSRLDHRDPASQRTGCFTSLPGREA
jgi:hypothetical protein